MKKLFLILSLLATGMISLAQCNDYYVLQQGSEWTYDNFDGKGKSSGKNIQKVKAYESTSDGFKATINSIIQNDKGKTLMEGDLDMTCTDGTIIIDMRKFIPEEQRKSFSSYEMKMESENLEIPSKLSPGQTLKNGTITMTAVGSPIPMKLSVNITDRKVEAKETITTPAGTFECYKISSKLTSTTQMGVNMTFQFASNEWIAENTGMVKSESFDKNGKLSGTTVLVSRK